MKKKKLLCPIKNDGGPGAKDDKNKQDD